MRTCVTALASAAPPLHPGSRRQASPAGCPFQGAPGAAHSPKRAPLIPYTRNCARQSTALRGRGPAFSRRYVNTPFSAWTTTRWQPWGLRSRPPWRPISSTCATTTATYRRQPVAHTPELASRLWQRAAPSYSRRLATHGAHLEVVGPLRHLRPRRRRRRSSSPSCSGSWRRSRRSSNGCGTRTSPSDSNHRGGPLPSPGAVDVRRGAPRRRRCRHHRPCRGRRLQLARQAPRPGAARYRGPTTTTRRFTGMCTRCPAPAGEISPRGRRTPIEAAGHGTPAWPLQPLRGRCPATGRRTHTGSPGSMRDSAAAGSTARPAAPRRRGASRPPRTLGRCGMRPPTRTAP